ncbi:hypothetical protein, partial [Salmonella enterica]|uniref:hypothetical protein n=1 Tax=Salmonella enterica TaxID=28901 RepID=UPI0039ED2107
MIFASVRRLIGAVTAALSATVLAAHPALAGPAMSRGQQDLPISYQDCLLRARAAFERNGWGSIGGGGGASFVSA